MTLSVGKSCRGKLKPEISVFISSHSFRNYTSLSGLQAFAPTNLKSPTSADGSVPLEVLIDLRCESEAFERLVPQTEAIFHYDKFNRLRLRNNTTSAATKPTTQEPGAVSDSHLQDQTVWRTCSLSLVDANLTILSSGPYPCTYPPVHCVC